MENLGRLRIQNLVVIYCVEFAKKNLFIDAAAVDDRCYSYYDEKSKNQRKEKNCLSGFFCCGSCQNRTCCSESDYFLDQSICSSSSSTKLTWWMITLICIFGFYILYCSAITIKTLCSKSNRRKTSRRGESHRITFRRSSINNMNRVQDTSNNTTSNQRSISLPTSYEATLNNYPPFGEPPTSHNNSTTLTTNLVFQQDQPPSYESLKHDPCAKGLALSLNT